MVIAIHSFQFSKIAGVSPACSESVAIGNSSSPFGAKKARLTNMTIIIIIAINKIDPPIAWNNWYVSHAAVSALPMYSEYAERLGPPSRQIGRASCRERGKVGGGETESIT